MCLACEMDALWLAEMVEEAERARAASPLPGGESASPLPVGERSTASVSETAGEGRSDLAGGERPSPGSLRDPTSPQRGEVQNPFFCEETRSE
jgi:hypothetical protein